jgi:zinc protease
MSVQQTLRERAERHAKRKRLPTLIVLIGISILVLAQLTKLLHERMQSKPSTEPALTELSTQSLSTQSLSTTTTDSSPEQLASNTNAQSPFAADVNQLIEAATAWPSSNFKLQSQQWTHTLGTPIYFIPAADLPMLDLRLIFNAGSARDNKLPGLASLTAALMDQGTDKLDVNSISEQLETLGSQLSIAAYRDMAVIQLRTLTDPANLQPTLQLLTRILSAPSFPDAALTRIRNQYLLALQQEQQQPAALIQKKMWQALYPQHPYGKPPSGTNESLSAITQADLKTFYQQHYTGANAVLAMVGAIDRKTAESISHQLLTALPAGSVVPALSPPSPISTQHIHIPFASQQTHIQIGVLGISRNHEQYAALYLANEILGGGGFSSRLNQVIREDAGLAYSIGSYFVPMLSQGPLMISMQTRNEKAAEALQKIDQVLAAMINDGPTESEIQSARQHIVRSYPLSLATNLNQVGQLASLAFYQLPAAQINDFPQQLMSVQTSSTLQILKQLLLPEQRIIITLGPNDPLAMTATPAATSTAPTTPAP